jgi:hypothetical protein
MHANEDIWEIRQIAIGKGMRVAKQATMGMMVTMGPATMAVMELVATTAVTMGLVMSQVMTMGLVTSQAMTMTRVATTTGLVTTVTMMGLVAMTELVTTRMSDVWGRRIG